MRAEVSIPVNWRGAMVILLAAALLTLWQHRAWQQGVFSAPERAVLAVGRPMQGQIAGAGQWLADLGQGLRQGPALAAENRRLARERDEARAEVTQLIGFYLENKLLRDQLGMAPVRQPEKIAARVVGLETRASRCRATVRVEQAGLIEVGDVVRQDRGLVGRVLRVQGRTAEVLLLVDPQAGVAARNVRSRDEGIVNPELVSALPATRLRLEKLAPLADLREGDLLVSSGLDQVYPAGVPIGTIERVMRSPAGAESITALVKPAVDFFRLEFVWILKQKPGAEPGG